MTTFSSQSVASLQRTESAADCVKFFTLTDSTQNIARELIRQDKFLERTDGKPTIYAIVADEQTAGRGRLGRKWVSRLGESFLVSFVTLLPKNIVMDAECNGWLSIIAGLAARDALLEVFEECGSQPKHGDECALKLKWPNDVFLHDCKEGGILTEIVAPANSSDSATSSDSADKIGVVFGIGLNLNVPQDVLPIKMSTSLHMHTTHLPAPQALRDMIAAKIVTGLRARLDNFISKYPQNSADLLAEVNAVSWTLGRAVNVHPVGGGMITGTAVRIGNDASLTIRKNSGEEIVVTSGDVQAVAY